MSWRRTWAIVLKELRQLRRDRLSLGMVIGIPVIQLILFGYAINTNVRGITAAIADQAHTSASRALVMDMLATGVVAPVAQVETGEQLLAMMRQGQVGVGITIPADFEQRRFDGRPVAQILVDGSDTSVQAAAAQLAQVPVDANARRRTPMHSSPDGGAIRIVSFYNPERRSPVSIVPGLIGVILTMTMVLFTSIAIVRERERGNMELLIATPLGSAELMIGKVLPYIGIGLVQVSMVLMLGVWLFSVPIRGSVVDVYLASGLLIVANLALGLLISTRVRSQFQAMQVTMFVFLPSILLSGFMFPFAGMPRFAQWLAEVLPLTHFIRLIRGVMLRGAELSELWPDVLALLAFAGVMMVLAILQFQKRLD
ncbi:MAG: ABC transporter permease [Xanthomonadales bacterium]|nr:ABC transporter permease [Xanthomonadales bacterium]